MKRFLRQPVVRGLLAALLAALVVFVAGFVNLFAIALENLELMTFDWRLRHFSSTLQLENAPFRDRIQLVGIDASSFKALKDLRDMRWPWNRRVYAEAIDAMTSAGVQLIGFDVFFSEPSRFTLDKTQDVALLDAVRRSGRVILAESADDPILPELAGAGLDLAFIEHVHDQDAISRRSRLLPVHPVTARHSLALTAALRARGQSAEDLVAVGPGEKPDLLRLPSVMSQEGGKIKLRHGARELPLLNGSDLQVNFFPVEYFPPAIPFYEVLIGHRLDRLKDKIVLVGATAKDLHDDFPTPVSVTLAAGTMPGVMIHMNALATILEGRCLTKAGGGATWLFTLLLLLPLSAAVGGARPKTAFAATFGSLALVFLFGVGAFYFRLVVEIVRPAVAISLLFVFLMAYNYLVEESEKRFIKDIFKQYVTEDVVEEILADPENALLSTGTRREVTILFSDIRNFTSLSETLPPEEVVELLNRYFDQMTGLVMEHGGTLDKYLGDGLLAIFGAPVRRETSAVDAVRCGLRMQKMARQLVDERLADRKRPFDGIGVGIHTGEVVVGSIGSEKHREYTAIGSVVNLASRIVGIAPADSVYISEATMRGTEKSFKFSAPFKSSFKGVREETTCYCVLGETEPAG